MAEFSDLPPCAGAHRGLPGLRRADDRRRAHGAPAGSLRRAHVRDARGGDRLRGAGGLRHRHRRPAGLAARDRPRDGAPARRDARRGDLLRLPRRRPPVRRRQPPRLRRRRRGPGRGARAGAGATSRLSGPRRRQERDGEPARRLVEGPRRRREAPGRADRRLGRPRRSGRPRHLRRRAAAGDAAARPGRGPLRQPPRARRGGRRHRGDRRSRGGSPVRRHLRRRPRAPSARARRGGRGSSLAARPALSLARLAPMAKLLPTTVIGSYPQPDWLVDREKLRGSLPPRVRAKELWRVEEPYLAQAQDDATALAIADLERAGLDIVTDGEIRRESYSNRCATALEGFDIDTPAMVPGRAGGTNAVPRVVDRVRRVRPVEVEDLKFLRARTDRTIKITLPGPFTMSQQSSNEFYDDEAELAMDLAAAVNEEVRDLFAAGADVVQIDEPWLQSRADKAREFAIPAINRALEGVSGTTALHTCFGYAHIVHDRPPGYPFLAELASCSAEVLAVEAAQPRLDVSVLEPLAEKTVIVGVIDLSDPEAETPEVVASRIEAALQVIPAERLQVGPDCGMKYLSRELAFAKLRALVEGARIVRERLA